MPKIDEFLRHAIANRASDIHFSSNEPIRMRVDGDLVPISDTRYTSEELETILFEILNDTERERIGSAKNLDKSHVVEGCGFFRVNIFWTRRGLAAVLRTIPKKIPTVEELNLPPACKMLAEAPKGLVLVTGPTGSGKSTTLAAMINHINMTQPLHILTAEDPVEFVHESKKSLINQREIGSSCHTFADALKYALREDPDVILVGEMRDLETIGLALTASETGHLVFGTLHTRGAGASVDRIIDSFPANQQAMIRTMLSESLIGVISQALLKRCDKPGRAAAFEVMVVNHAISNLIREGKTFQIPSIIQTGRKEGMILMDQNILELVDAGIVAPEEGEIYMEDPGPMQTRKKNRPIPAAGAAGAAKPAAPNSPGAPPQLKVVQGSKPTSAPPLNPPGSPKATAAAPPTAKAASQPTPKAPPAEKRPVASPAPAVAPAPAEPEASTGDSELIVADDEVDLLTDLTATGQHETAPSAGSDPQSPFLSSNDPFSDDDSIGLKSDGDSVVENTGQLEEDPFAPSKEIDIHETLDLPSAENFSETKVVERDDTATAEVRLTHQAAPAPRSATPAKPAPPVPSRAAAAAPPPSKPATPVPAKPAVPPPSTKPSGPPPIGAKPPPAPGGARLMPPPPPGSAGRPIPPPPGAPQKKTG